MKPNCLIAGLVALLPPAAAHVAAGESLRLDTALYVYRSSDFRTIEIPGAASAVAENRALVFRAPATIRFDQETLSLEGPSFRWSGGLYLRFDLDTLWLEDPSSRWRGDLGPHRGFSLIADPAVAITAGTPVTILSSVPTQYLEKLADGTLQVRDIPADSPDAPHCRLTFTLGAAGGAADELPLACELDIATIGSREDITGVALPVGKPVLARFKEKLNSPVRVGEWSALLLQAPNGSDYSMLVLLKIVPGLAPGTVVGAEQARRPMTTAELDRFASAYYRHPQPELIPAAIEALGPSGFLRNRFWVFVGFFAEVFADNPDRMEEWRKLITWKDWSTRDCLRAALELSRPGAMLALDGPWYRRPGAILSLGNSLGSVNDMRWGAFFASGNPAYLRKLVEQLRFIDTIRAVWSLARNAPEHPLVRMTLEAVRKETDPRTREIIDDLLKKDPEAIRQEIQRMQRMDSMRPSNSGDIGPARSFGDMPRAGPGS